MEYGILAYGAYLPRRRLPRRSIIEANAWFDSSLRGLGKGERTMCGWDEDPITMAVDAARDALPGSDASSIQSVLFASTTFPFLDRLNSGVVAAALNLSEDIASADLGACQRAATSALAQAFKASKGTTLVVAAEQRKTKSASPLELTSGDGAAAILVGEGKPIAKLLAQASGTQDFVDHYRTIESEYDYRWEDRWVRDEGFLKLVSPVVARCLKNAGLTGADVTHFCLPTTLAKGADAIAKKIGIAPEAVRDNLQLVCGDTGTAHPLVMLADALAVAKPGDRILVAAFGQGADALLFEVTDAIKNFAPVRGVQGHLARRKEEPNYIKFLAFRDGINLERGIRAEQDKQTPLAMMWRNRAAYTSFVGGKCTKCGTPQYPISRICVNPECNAVDTQEPYSFADKIGRINSYTADLLAYSPEPPSCYGMVEFKEGGRWMMDMIDMEASDLAVGLEMRMVFRIRDIDTQRGFRRYHWKATPVADSKKGA
jgi:3-hydroxy-3-methylglutaryl CoA synthase